MKSQENKIAHFRSVKVGIVEGERVEILEPSAISGYVVTLGHHLLEDGANIILPPNAPLSSEVNAETLRKPTTGEKNSPGVKR